MKCKPVDGRNPAAPPGTSAWLAATLALVLALAAWPASALDDDSKKPMYVESDIASYNGQKGETIYVGNVKAKQGSLEATGEKMVVFQKDGKTERLVIYGNPARIKQTPEPGKPDNHGLGQRVDYFPDTGILILYEKAMTWEGDDPARSEHTVKSERIEYDTKNSIYKAGTASSSKKRVQVTILPKDAR